MLRIKWVLFLFLLGVSSLTLSACTFPWQQQFSGLSVLAAEGATLLLEKLSPALEQVDSSSGAVGSALNRAVTMLVPLIAKADVDSSIRQRWLERLWEALQKDSIPYVELLSDHWGDLCAEPALASQWADTLLAGVTAARDPSIRHGSYVPHSLPGCTVGSGPP